jgi:hypothetical protein
MKENNELVSIKLAELARMKGFNDICDNGYCFDNDKQAYYINYDPKYFQNDKIWEKHYAAPTREQLHTWLRDRKIFITIEVDQTLEPKFCYSLSRFIETAEEGCSWTNHDPSGTALFYKYEQALDEALEEGLKLL